MRLPTDQKCCHLVRSSTHRHPKTRNANHPVLFHQRCCWKLSLVRRGFVRITFCLPLVLPTVSLPKFSVVGLAESCPVWGAQVPPRVIGGGGVGALLANDKLPVTLPELDGAKSTVIVPEPPAGTVIGSDSPTVPKPAPVVFSPDRCPWEGDTQSNDVSPYFAFLLRRAMAKLVGTCSRGRAMVFGR